ncbi:hypothetical protein Hdeb2414_s0005g00162621 [Helianthus debilis subsp. tardiflorus]
MISFEVHLYPSKVILRAHRRLSFELIEGYKQSFDDSSFVLVHVCDNSLDLVFGYLVIS